MNKIIQLTILILTFASVQGVAVSQQTLTMDTVFAKMEKANKDYPYLQGNVEKSIYNDLANKLRFDKSGKIWIAQTGNSRQVRVEFDKPLKEFWSLDKGVFWDYYPKTKTATKVTFKQEQQPEAECVFLGLCGSTTQIKQFYTATLGAAETINGVKTVLVELRPKDQKRESLFSLVKLWLDTNKWYPVQTQVIEPNKNYNIFKYSGFKTGSFSNSVFKLDIPKDVVPEEHKF